MHLFVRYTCLGKSSKIINSGKFVVYILQNLYFIWSLPLIKNAIILLHFFWNDFSFMLFSQEISAQDTPESEVGSQSLNSSTVFVDNLQFSSISQFGDTLELEEGELMRGLEFPDIERDSESDTEAVQPAGKSHVDSEPTHSKQMDEAKDSKEQVNQQISETLESTMKESISSDVSDYEMLDPSEAEGMIPTDQTDSGNSSRLGSATDYVGKWLGY